MTKIQIIIEFFTNPNWIVIILNSISNILQTISTYTDKASLALGVAEDFVHRALLQRVDLLTNKLIPVGRM